MFGDLLGDERSQPARESFSHGARKKRRAAASCRRDRPPGLAQCISLLKGAAFATALYESPGARAMADVDRASKAPGFLALATLSPEDHLVHLCLHASFQHGFRQPAINAWDVRLLLRDAAFDQKTFITRASAPRLLPWVFGGLKLSQLAFPEPQLDALVDELGELAPKRLRQKLGTLGPADVFAPEANGTTRPPIRRLLWIGDAATAWTLLFEVLRPRAYENTSRPLGSTRRAFQLIWNHYLRVILHALMKHTPTPWRHTPASLGEIRDV